MVKSHRFLVFGIKNVRNRIVTKSHQNSRSIKNPGARINSGLPVLLDKRRRRDLNPRVDFSTYTLSRGASSTS